MLFGSGILGSSPLSLYFLYHILPKKKQANRQIKEIQFVFICLFLFLHCWVLNLGHYTCQTRTLLLSYIPSSLSSFLTGMVIQFWWPVFWFTVFRGAGFVLATIRILKDDVTRIIYLIVNWCMKRWPGCMPLSRNSLRRNGDCTGFLIAPYLPSWVHRSCKELARNL